MTLFEFMVDMTREMYENGEELKRTNAELEKSLDKPTAKIESKGNEKPSVEFKPQNQG